MLNTLDALQKHTKFRPLVLGASQQSDVLPEQLHSTTSPSFDKYPQCHPSAGHGMEEAILERILISSFSHSAGPPVLGRRRVQNRVGLGYVARAQDPQGTERLCGCLCCTCPSSPPKCTHTLTPLATKHARGCTAAPTPAPHPHTDMHTHTRTIGHTDTQTLPRACSHLPLALERYTNRHFNRYGRGLHALFFFGKKVDRQRWMYEYD